MRCIKSMQKSSGNLIKISGLDAGFMLESMSK